MISNFSISKDLFDISGIQVGLKKLFNSAKGD